MKRFMMIMLVTALAVSLMGCSYNSGKDNKKAEGSSAETNAAKEAQATAEAAAAATRYQTPELTFRYGEVNGEDNINTRTGYKFAEYVDELSNGRINIEIYPNHALGDERTSLRDLRRGGRNIDMYRANTNALTGYGFKNLNLFALPYVFNSREGMWKVLEDEELGQAFLSEGTEVGANMMGLFYTDEGARNLFSTRQINGLEDLKGMRIRVPESVLVMDILSALGARPIPMPYNELKDALIHGNVEGAENPLTAYMSNKFYEIAPYYLLTGHAYSPGIVLMAEEKWNALSEEDQKILLEAGRRASEWNKAAIVEEEARLMKELVEKGVTITELTPEEMQQARDLEEIVRVSFTPGLGELLNRIIETQN